ncbi:predicted protein [Histoplasma mississippiense (nom. inval.)]|uniref:predicted protein n=1 Tax=Ajellomyces capsulatus (strain NAm1 / WU24) TaxID=2059318 RepID=UPI000157B3FE|nr:predicted protein [Histoplasma mississippiense (nom. inval.)]EDN03225.1 predicted protein [Histoplasma mississippiense (nom. inval.)]
MERSYKHKKVAESSPLKEMRYCRLFDQASSYYHGHYDGGTVMCYFLQQFAQVSNVSAFAVIVGHGKFRIWTFQVCPQLPLNRVLYMLKVSWALEVIVDVEIQRVKGVGGYLFTRIRQHHKHREDGHTYVKVIEPLADTKKELGGREVGARGNRYIYFRDIKVDEFQPTLSIYHDITHPNIAVPRKKRSITMYAFGLPGSQLEHSLRMISTVAEFDRQTVAPWPMPHGVVVSSRDIGKIAVLDEDCINFRVPLFIRNSLALHSRGILKQGRGTDRGPNNGIPLVLSLAIAVYFLCSLTGSPGHGAEDIPAISVSPEIRF